MRRERKMREGWRKEGGKGAVKDMREWRVERQYLKESEKGRRKERKGEGRN